MTKSIAKGIDCVYLPASDPRVSAEWYVKHLGLTLLRPITNNAQAQLGFPSGSAIFLMQTKESQNANYHDIFGNEQCLLTIEIENFDEAFDAIRSAGVKTDPIEDNGGCGRNFYVYDPDGNKIDLWSGWPNQEQS
ncbi:VOC family protein [Paenibacillus spongiae]|uniref:VOC family protein n=1 Tax=Paenibacillus spongiae TaxID=2909671 RepID=A0ABY5S9H9_9BACL|nr:VOC family protein [Paenibacillus spongiae]UVI29190.1 VOC family protein [Paenibacillus spongiae]